MVCAIFYSKRKFCRRHTKRVSMEEERVQCAAMARTARIAIGQQSLWCIITQKDDVCFSFRFRDDAKGQDVMDQVCEKLGIVEKDYFGLQYANSRGEVHWLNMRNRISRQLSKPEPYSLMFCVKFYVPPHQLLQESSRKQFFLNVKSEFESGKYELNEDVAVTLFALVAQTESGHFRENHISYNPSRTADWTPEFQSKVILEHCKLKDMTKEVAEFFFLKEISELSDYGIEWHNVKTDEGNRTVSFGIGIDCLKVDRDCVSERIPYTCLRMSTHSGKTVKIDIYINDLGDTDSIVYRLNSKEAACALYRSITEHHAFYRCDSIRPAVKEQVARDFRDMFLSWFYDDINADYIFDTERTCREAYDHARRILYNFGATTAAAMTASQERKYIPAEEQDENGIKERYNKLQDELYTFKESFHCLICCDNIVDTVLQCGHFICDPCTAYCEVCPMCRSPLITKTKCYLPVTFASIHS